MFFTKYFNFLSDTLNTFNHKLVTIATIFLLFSFQILAFTQQKPHYIIVVFICFLLVIINMNGYFNYIKFFYLFPLLLSIFYFICTFN